MYLTDKQQISNSVLECKAFVAHKTWVGLQIVLFSAMFDKVTSNLPFVVHVHKSPPSQFVIIYQVPAESNIKHRFDWLMGISNKHHRDRSSKPKLFTNNFKWRIKQIDFLARQLGKRRPQLNQFLFQFCPWQFPMEKIWESQLMLHSFFLFF